MNIQVELTNPDKAYIIKNMYPLYLHDLSGHYGLQEAHRPNVHGIYEASSDYRTLQDQYDVQNIWWEKPGCLYPFLFLASGTPVGFAFVATPPYCSEGTDYFMHEFFLMQPFRGVGLAEQAATTIFAKFRGRWEIFTNPNEKNRIGQQFWRKTMTHYTEGNYRESVGATHDGHKMIFQFSNL
ncbi:GNAT family N-acetyltransferase [Paenibacillus sp. RRE4]|uniref:GNAT family N-acetyltransferase n=1 Tax=Paenibacillus sp. RRE4 TaxID=2962587 RepID=UPI002880EFC9|nr:GNAT family N-acetyltransferase [Paenibacillus sp. RRE4]MDT0124810.1 GNAT family N-acetyltransferase [Paenibacillus sp. RRE4]